jgi:hypothetical protein
MTLLVSTLVLTLAWFSALNIVSSLMVWLIAGGLRRGQSFVRPSAQWLFALRLAPFLISSVFAIGVFLPVHLMYEGREGSEYFGALLWSGALLAVGLIGGSAVRVVLALRGYGRLRRTWGRPVGGRCPIVSDCEILGISLAGILRPTIVVGRRVREALTREELDVALAHEVAHWQSWDNVKRFAMFASPDVLRFTRAAADLERGWCAEAECLADARAVDGDASLAVNLASALVKVARLATARSEAFLAGPLWSAFHQEGLLELRIRRLVDGPIVAPRSSWLLLVGSTAATLGTIALAYLADVPRAVHFLTEGLVQLLP